MSTKNIVHASLYYDFFRNKALLSTKVLYLRVLCNKKVRHESRT